MSYNICLKCAKSYLSWSENCSIVQDFGFCSSDCYTKFYKLTSINEHCLIYLLALGLKELSYRPYFINGNYRIERWYSESILALVNKKDLETIKCTDWKNLPFVKVIGVYKESYDTGIKASLIRAKRKTAKHNLIPQLERQRLAARMK